MRALVLVALVSAASPAATPDDEAKQVYSDGKQAYEAGRFEEAYRDFDRAYEISRRPALLFNMAKALEQLGRSHDAAERLRAYLQLVPDDRERVEIEARIRAFDEKQRLVDEAQRPPRPNPLPRREKLAGLTLVVGGVVLVAVGGAFGGLAVAADHRYLHPANGVYSPDAEDERARDQQIEPALLAIGGAALATGVVLYALGWKQTHRWSLHAWLAPSLSGLVLDGRF